MLAETNKVKQRRDALAQAGARHTVKAPVNIEEFFGCKLIVEAEVFRQEADAAPNFGVFDRFA